MEAVIAVHEERIGRQIVVHQRRPGLVHKQHGCGNLLDHLQDGLQVELHGLIVQQVRQGVLLHVGHNHAHCLGLRLYTRPQHRQDIGVPQTHHPCDIPQGLHSLQLGVNTSVKVDAGHAGLPKICQPILPTPLHEEVGWLGADCQQVMLCKVLRL